MFSSCENVELCLQVVDNWGVLNPVVRCFPAVGWVYFRLSLNVIRCIENLPLKSCSQA